jgi:hypothetical protein
MINTGEMVISGPDMDVGISDGSGPDSWVRGTAAQGLLVGQTSIDPVEGLGRFTVGWHPGVVQWRWDGQANNWAVRQSNFVDSANPPGYVLPWEGEAYRTWYFPRYARNPNDRMHFVSGSDVGVFESRDGGYTWFLISPNIRVESYGFRRDGTIIAATGDGFLLSQTSPGARTWEKRDLTGCLLVQGNTCSNKAAHFVEFALSPNPSDQGLYATAQDAELPKVWYSADGRTWQALDRGPEQVGGLPGIYGSTTLAIDADNPRHLYAGTPYGLYASEDNGQNWSPIESPFPLTPVSRLKFMKDSSGRTKPGGLHLRTRCVVGPGGVVHGLRRRADLCVVVRLRAPPVCCRHHQRMRRNPGALLPRSSGTARTDGGVPAQGHAR